MSPVELLADSVRRRLPRAQVDVTADPGGYQIRVVSAQFQGMPPGDARARVYQTLDRVPVEVVARVTGIECSAG